MRLKWWLQPDVIVPILLFLAGIYIFRHRAFGDDISGRNVNAKLLLTQYNMPF